MMRLKLVLPSLLLFMLAGGVSSVSGSEASLKKALEGNFPDEKIESVQKTPYLGLFEVVIGGFIRTKKLPIFFSAM